MMAETAGGLAAKRAMLDRDNEERGCSCHLSAPCSWCESLTEEEASAVWNGGMDALRALRAEAAAKEPG